MSDERERLLARLRAAVQSGEAPDRARRRLRLRRDTWDALNDEAATLDAPPAPDAAAAAHCACQGTGTLGEPLLRLAESICALRPPADANIDQVPVGPEDLARRVALMGELDDLEGRSILFVGDDDFTSLMVCSAAPIARALVLDIDERILGRLDAAARERGLPLETMKFDLERFLTEPLPPAIAEQFDGFVTDPPYSEHGMLLFAAVGMAALRRAPDTFAYVAVPWMEREAWSDELLFVVQRAFVQQGFYLTDVRRAFHAYPHDDGIYSTMIRAQALTRERDPSALVRSYNPRKLYSSRRWTKLETNL